MYTRALCVALIAGGLCASAQASVFFTFDDPAPGPEIRYTIAQIFADTPGPPSGGPGGTPVGFINFSSATLAFTVDATEEGLGVQTYDANLSMSIFIDQATSSPGGIFSAPIIGGSFAFDLVGNAGVNSNILSGSLTGGNLLTLGTAGALLSTSSITTGAFQDLTLTAGSVLSLFLNGQTLAPTFDIAFTLTNISTPPTINPDGFLTPFTANSAFSGNAELIPSPGSAALAGISMSLLMIRRKRS